MTTRRLRRARGRAGSSAAPARGRGLAGAEAPRLVSEVLRTSGQPLDRRTRSTMEARLGHDFGDVRVHTDTRAAASALSVDALAYTVGRDVVFGPRQYRPAEAAGASLLAHELVHVVQQRGARSDRPLRIGRADDAVEREADLHSRARSSGPGAATPLPTAPARILQRRPATGELADQLRRGGTLPYREATELAECIRIMGPDSTAECRQEVLGEAPPPPTHVAVPGISTPVPFAFDRGTRRRPGASGEIGGVQVRIRPDVRSRSRSMRNRAETKQRFSAFDIRFRSRAGRVTSFTGPGPVTLTIQTTYGPGVSATSTSGYGRGTTAEDVAAGDTSLGFHEGRHGLDYLDFLAAHPFPVFTGTVGMTTAEFTDAMTEYRDARLQYQRDLARFSVERTDCVGTTIDDHNLANGEITTECVAVP